MPDVPHVTSHSIRTWPVMLAAWVTLAFAPQAFAQHEPTVADIDEGRRLFLGSCTQCHGAEGDAVFGVDLTHGRFRSSTTDADLLRVIRTGLPGTGMPPSAFTETQAGNLIAYLRSLVSTPVSFVPGDAARGRTLFEGKGACGTCHRVGETGSRLGPDLSDIGQVRPVDELRRALAEPNAEILPPNRPYRVVTREGATITGRLLNHDSFTVQLIDAQGQLRSFNKGSLKEYAFVDASPMPSARDRLSPDEIVDVIRYLVSLKGVKANTP